MLLNNINSVLRAVTIVHLLFTPLAVQAAGVGAVESVSEGIVKGWVASPSKVQFYLEHPKGAPGMELFFETDAALQRADGKTGFEAKIPEPFGDEATHKLFAYVLVDNKAQPLVGTPVSFQFKSIPTAWLKIISPKEGGVVPAGKPLKIKYAVEGDKVLARHLHWKIDNGFEVMDMDAKGTLTFPTLPPGPHQLTGYLARSHHEKILHTDVTVKFEAKNK